MSDGPAYLAAACRAAAEVPELAAARAHVRPVRRVGVIGGGTMGRDIAFVHLLAGHDVALREADAARLDAAVAAVRGHVARRVARGDATEAQGGELLARLTPTLDDAPLADADLIVEAVVEVLDVKREVFARIGALVRPDAILASNTSTLPIAELAAVVSDPSRVVGLHFFSPARVMRLVEVVRAAATSDATAAAALAHVAAIGKVPVLVGDCYGFVSNRLSMAYLAEATALLDEGASPAEVDAALVAFGMPMGPLTMSDMAGVDISHLAQPGLQRAYGARARRSPVVARLYALGRHGQKAGKGWYRYEAGKSGDAARHPDPEFDALLAEQRAARGITPRSIASDEIVARVVYVTANEGARCLEEGIARTPEDVDVVMGLGFGFPAQRGGLMKYVDDVGATRVVAALEAWRARATSEEEAARYEPARWLVARAERAQR
ncbi:3-hydroxyacyl-CoA dehydrogenase [Roseisolibacter agri]|uniref:3-hydroxyacyl-CoA dehydrogenase n=1 Tax=Roseisolibacter agri TaxID=2014610 RepID=UPI0024E08B7E|nr:3-hydroxyacyl-CoA dehydrogenase [Roseisolibacter agri]